MSMQSKIRDMTNTPYKLNELEKLSAEDKLQIILKLSESVNFVDLLYFIEQAHNDADWCHSYR